MALLVSISALLGCASVPHKLNGTRPALGKRLAGKSYQAPELVYAAVTVKDFGWAYQNLASWGNSARLLDRLLAKQLRVPSSRRFLISEPDEEDLRRFMASLVTRVHKNQILLLYLGTHHLKNGQLLLGRKQRIPAEEFVKMLTAVPGRIVLLSDVCYADALERAKFPPNVIRLHASSSKEAAVDLRFRTTTRHIRDLFAETRGYLDQLVGQTEDSYSFFGFTVVHCLLQLLADTGGLRVDRLAAEVERTVKGLQKVNKVPLPMPLARNCQHWLLGGLDQFAADLKLFEQLLHQQKPGYEEGMMLIGRLYHSGLDVPRYRKRLDEMEADLRQSLEGVTSADDQIRAISSYFYGELGIRAIDAPFAEDFLVHHALENRRGRCSSLTALYLIMGDRLGVPVQAACLPEHIFVRWGNDALNVETTLKGERMTDEQYRKSRPWVSSKKADAFYLKGLSRSQVLSTYLSPLANLMLQRGQPERARQLLKLSLRYNPSDAEAWNHLGMVHAAERKPGLAKASYRQALAINPSFAEAWNNLGNTESDPAAKLQHYQRAVALKPKLAVAWRNLSLLWNTMGQYEEALAAAKRCAELGYLLSPSYIQALKNKRKK